MCGICGAIAGNSYSAVDIRDGVERMTATLEHRGPDDAGVWIDAETGVAFGHRRLSIIDLSQLGHQPMESASGRFVMTFNGEIYNYRSLRAELGDKGRRFRSTSDSEVLLHAFEEWGIEGAVRRTVGMFAIAIWDRERRRLHLVRDRVGEKPLYYGWQGDTFLFGSELKALQAHPSWDGSIDRQAAVLYFRFNYVPAPYSIFGGIRKLPPGTILTIDPANRGAEPTLSRYWDLHEIAANALARPAVDVNDAERELHDLLRDAIRQQMVSDVPLGAFLSGGIDSSTIVALMQEASSQPVRTFTIGFSERAYDESPHAKRVAAHLGTAHTEMVVTAREAMDVIPSLPAMYDEPFADSSQIPTFLVSRLARQHVTVSLSGDGGDELFGGYERYVMAPRIWNSVSWMPRVSRAPLATVLRGISGQFSGHTPRRLSRIADVVECTDRSSVYNELVRVWSAATNPVLSTEQPDTIIDRQRDWPAVSSFEETMMFLDAVTYLPDDILVKVDRAAMAVSLETRVPFLDHRVVEFAWRLPLSMKIRGTTGKHLLRRILNRYVPSELVERPKMGFGIPVGEWIRSDLRAWAEELLDERTLRDDGVLDPESIRRLWRRHLGGHGGSDFAVWGVLMFQAWMQAQREHAPSYR